MRRGQMKILLEEETGIRSMGEDGDTITTARGEDGDRGTNGTNTREKNVEEKDVRSIRGNTEERKAREMMTVRDGFGNEAEGAEGRRGER
jgi:hypothetical protein